MGRFCVQCGAEGRKFIHGLCEECYWRSVEGIPPDVKVTFCRACFSHLRGKRWMARRGRGLDEEVIEAAREEFLRRAEPPEGVEVTALRGEVLERDTESGFPKKLALTATLTEKESGTSREERSEAYVDYRLCQSCGCVVRGRYDAMVQIRAEGRDLDARDSGMVGRIFEDFYHETRDRGRQEVVEVREHEGGIDVKFASLNAARLFVKMLQEATGAAVSDNPKIAGIDKRTGARIYRTTYAVRLPELREGDIIEAEGRVYIILGYHRGSAVVRDLEEAGKLGAGIGTGRGRRSLPPHVMASAEKVAADRVRRVRLEAKTEAFATFLDLDGKCFLDVPSERVPLNMEVGETGLLISVGDKEVVYKEEATGGAGQS